MTRSPLIELAIGWLRFHAWLQYDACTLPDQKSKALRKQASAIIEHDRILTGRTTHG